MNTWIRSLALAAALLASHSALADQIVCTADGFGNDSCDITFPNVLAPSTTYPTVNFDAGDVVTVSGGGCVQTGGSGRTWKRFVDPSGWNSDRLYHGLVSIPGSTPGLVRIQDIQGVALPASSGGPLVLGYEDDDHDDNGYWSHDNGTEDQCRDQSGPNRGRAFVHLQIQRAAKPAMPAGTVYGQCTRFAPTLEGCSVDRPDVTSPIEAYPSIRFCPGDLVTVKARGCVQTGGSGRTWKRYVAPSGPNSKLLYHGWISIPGVTNGLEPIDNVVGKPNLPASTGGVLTLGYADDMFADNGYWSHDDGTEGQCANTGPVSIGLTITHGRDTFLGCGNVFPVTGTTPETAGAAQSETAATVASIPGGGRRIVVAYNDQTQTPGAETIKWTASGRQVFTGASLMGWSYSDDDGRQWRYGGRVQTSEFWPAIWGDPSIAAIPGTTEVLMVNLAVPKEEFVSGNNIMSVGGAVVARSWDGGATFAFYQALTNAFHFYDGSAVAALNDGAAFAAFEDIDTRRIDVWRAPPGLPFVRIAEPFPNMMALTHPRLRAGPDGAMYIASVFPGAKPDGTYGSFVYLNRYANGAWGTPQRASEAMVSGGTVDLHSVVLASPLTVRMGPQFGFDVGNASAGKRDAIRIVATRQDSNGRFFVEGSACALDLSTCQPVPEWSVGPMGPDRTQLQAFHPSVKAVRVKGKVQRPRPWRPVREAPGWASTYLVMRGNQSTFVQAGRMQLNYLAGVPVAKSDIAPDNLAVCSDRRGYWGDYNDMVGLPGRPVYISFVTRDQLLGCTERSQYRGMHQHVAAVRWDP